VRKPFLVVVIGQLLPGLGSGRRCSGVSPLNVPFTCSNNGPTGTDGYCSFVSESTRIRAVLEVEDTFNLAPHVVIPATKQ
jgi:hypothetical protein